jgi:G:T-mismatch repair DNA endonuclease (very short patch repair protein)
MKTAALEAEGWEVAIVWSCETKDVDTLASMLSTFLGPQKIRRV